MTLRIPDNEMTLLLTVARTDGYLPLEDHGLIGDGASETFALLAVFIDIGR